LIRFLQTLGIPIVATIRDSQNYARCAELGLGVHEMKSYIAREDVEQWEPLVQWLDKPTAPRESPYGPATPAIVSA
jgi:chromosome partitioning protein